MYLKLSLPQVTNIQLLHIISVCFQQTVNENTQTKQVEVVILILHQSLVANLIYLIFSPYPKKTRMSNLLLTAK